MKELKIFYPENRGQDIRRLTNWASNFDPAEAEAAATGDGLRRVDRFPPELKAAAISATTS